MNTRSSNNPITGAGYLLKGFQMVTKPRMRRFVIIPGLINILVFGAALYFSAGWVFDFSVGLLPDWLDWLAFVLVPLALAIGLTVMFFTFTMLANLLASPFNGVLAEAVELRLTGRELPPSTVIQLIKDVGVSLGSELRKFVYIMVRIIPLLLLLLVPLVGPFLWAGFSAWMLAVTFSDYPMANHGLTFPQQRRILGERRWMALGFGVAVMFAMTVPVLNFFVMPCAVAGATVMWVEQFADTALTGENAPAALLNEAPSGGERETG